jgi:hypothetical protein
MKILCTKNESIPIQILKGWENSFKTEGHSFTFWNNRHKPTLDAFDETRPDLLIFSSNDISRGLYRCITENPETKSILLVSENNPRENIEYIKTLIKDTGKPDLIIGVSSKISESLKNLGPPYLLSLPAADTTIYQPRKFQKNWSSDISFIGEFTEGNSNYILPLCESDYPYSIRIFGRKNEAVTDWPVPNYVGIVLEENIPNIYSSSKIIIDLSEGIDIYNITACKGFCLTNDKNNILDLPSFDSQEKIFNLIDYYIYKEKERKSVSEDRQLEVIKNHTYINRVKEILRTLE